MITVKTAVIAASRSRLVQSIGFVDLTGCSLTIIVRAVVTMNTAMMVRIAAQRLPAVTMREMVKATKIKGRGSSKKALMPE